MQRILGLLCVALLACDRKLPPPPFLAKAPGPAPDPSRIPSVAAWKSLGPPRPSQAGPHRGSTQKVYLNAVASKAMAEGHVHPWPDGSQFVKEAFDAQGGRMAWFWMSKERGEWVWAQADADAKVDERVQGTENACAACHLARAEKFDGACSLALADPGTPDHPRQ
ncbi:MAG TPA: cytochrome P460 family protein [Holophagaceae bacterium]|nr:cytochrome P460 family protein [Holophagaceae bacterium]